MTTFLLIWAIVASVAAVLEFVLLVRACQECVAIDVSRDGWISRTTAAEIERDDLRDAVREQVLQSDYDYRIQEDLRKEAND